MRKTWLPAIVLATIVASLLQGTPAQAQATRTWISGVGDDVNPCSRTAPCKTFAGAISKTAANGEINCLDPGGFGAVTITKSITLDCHEVFGSILAAGTSGIIIAPNVTGVVVNIRNININGAGTGIVGINIVATNGASAAKVQIEDVLINGFTSQGIKDARTGGQTQLIIRNTTVRNNIAAGIVPQAGATNSVVLENVHSVGNAFGLAVGTGNNVVVRNSVMSGNGTAGIEADAGAQVFVDNTMISHNNIGVQPAGVVVLGNSDIAFNSTAISAATTSFGNNRIFGNFSNGTTPALGAASTDHGQQ